MTIERKLLLGERKGLPDDLLVIARSHPRDTWEGHENLTDLARFWLRRHDMFRDLGAMLNGGMERYREGELDAGGLTGWFLPRLNFFIQNLEGHHQIEDQHYFPQFRAAEQRLAKGFDLLDSDHHILHDALVRNAEKARELLEAMGADKDRHRRATDGFATDTANLVTLMMQHLEDEEDLIVPIILKRGEGELGIS